MSAKKIYPKEMFGTPEVNILNDNVLSSVDYNYNVVDSQYREVATFSFSDLVEDYEDAKSYSNANNEVLYDGRKSNYDLKIDRLYADKIVKTITKNAGTSQNGQIWASPLFYILKMEYYVDRPLDFNKFRVSYSIQDKVAKTMNPISSNGENVLTLRSQSYDSVFADSSIKYFSNESDVVSYYNGYVLEAPLFGMPPCIIATDSKVVLYFALHYYSLNNYFTTTYDSYSYIVKSVNIRLANKCLEVSPISVDTNSQLVLQGNELIQEGSNIGLDSWISIVPQKIANEYKNGKATINLTVVYDGTNEYPVGYLVIPMKSDTEPILRTSYEQDFVRNFNKDNFVYYENVFMNNIINLNQEIPELNELKSVSFSWNGVLSDGYNTAFSGEKSFSIDIPSDVASGGYVYNDDYISIRVDWNDDYGDGNRIIRLRYKTTSIVDYLNDIDVSVDGILQKNDPKEFEVTSNEIVYTGRSIQNLELVEYVEVE